MTTILDAARQSQLAGLEAMRDKLASDMDAAEPSYVAQIAARLQAVLTEIEAVKKAQPGEGSKFDELADRRANRRPDPKRRASPTRNRDKRSG